MAEIKCPCGLRNYMEEEDYKKTNCNACCPLTKPQTNADRIRAMSDEELARFFADKIENEYILSQKRLGYSEHTLTATQIEAIRHNCYCIWIKWLKQPVADNVDRCVSCGEIIPEGRQVCPDCESKTDNKENDYGSIVWNIENRHCESCQPPGSKSWGRNSANR